MPTLIEIIAFLPNLLVAVFPVLVFLAGLLYMDSYKLVPILFVLVVIFLGGAAAGASYLANTSIMQGWGVEPMLYTRYGSPLIEECLKGMIVFFLLRTHRIGFMVDAAILGFAVGTGFAVVENLYFLTAIDQAHWFVWVVRGFGTAIMHGGTTAILALISMILAEKRGITSLTLMVPGFLAASVLHSFFNHFFLTPVLSTALILAVLPLLLAVVYMQGEKSLQKWLGSGFASDVELLELLEGGSLSDSPIGSYLESLRQRFPGPILADLLCYLKIYTELSLRAKGVLLARESGFDPNPALNREIRESLQELQFLEKSIGRTGKLAVEPFLRLSSRDLWQVSMLEAAMASSGSIKILRDSLKLSGSATERPPSKG